MRAQRRPAGEHSDQDLSQCQSVLDLQREGVPGEPGIRPRLPASEEPGKLTYPIPSAARSYERNRPAELSEEHTPASPPPFWGRDRVGGIPEHPRSGVPPPLAAPYKG